MNSKSVAAGVCAAAVLLFAADEPVVLKPSALVAKDVAAFPRLAASDAVAQKINQALARRDAQVKSTARDCPGGGWSRSVSVAMRGPRYLALVARDSWDCGGAHPDAAALVLVYDLSTGSPVNWARLLPPGIIQAATLDTAGDGTPIGVIQSKALQDYYVKARISNQKDPLDPDCKDVVTDPALKFNLWPDAAAGGLALEPEGLPHVVLACGDSVVVPLADLRKMGVQAGLVDAIETAHAHGWFDAQK
jgi:hypothetical protein